MEKSIMPVPLSGTVKLDGLALSETVIVPDLVPAAVGVNVTLTLHVAPTASCDPTQVSVSEKSPVALTAEMFMAASLELDKVITG